MDAHSRDRTVKPQGGAWGISGSHGRGPYFENKPSAQGSKERTRTVCRCRDGSKKASSFVSSIRLTIKKEDRPRSSIQAQLSTEHAPLSSQRCLVNQKACWGSGQQASFFALAEWPGFVSYCAHRTSTVLSCAFCEQGK
jgi:hypothetical protein